MKGMNYLAIAMLSVINATVGAVSTAANGLEVLNDQELSAETGQALFNLAYTAPNDSANLMTGKTIAGAAVGNVGFYKLGMEAEIELNANIKKLQLGCGGRNGPNACDIEINNLGLSGLPDGGTHDQFGVAQAGGGYDANGSPVYSTSKPRPATSAKLVNPFIQFAIKNPDSASTRQVLGFRTSAEEIYGMLSAGTDNLDYANGDGIQSLSGFMRLAGTSGSVDTKETLFGNTGDQRLGAYTEGGAAYLNPDLKPNMIVSLLGTHKRIMQSNPGTPENHGISVPAIKGLAFNTPAFQVNGVRNTLAEVKGIKLKIDAIPMGKVADVNGNYTSVGAKNQLYVTYDPILGLASDAKFQMADGSDVRNLNLDITFQQSLSMFHNIPLNGNGGYLALQAQKILWPGAYIDSTDAGKTEINNMTRSDVAQAGWWMSFEDEVRLGKLKATDPVDISSALPQVARLSSKYLQDNPVLVSGSEGLQSLFGTPITKLLNIDLETYTNPTLGGTPARVTMSNLKLANQNLVPNCYGTLKFC